MEAKRALASRWLGSKLLDQCIEVIIHTEITARERIGIAAGESQHQLHGAVDRRIASFGVQGLVPLLHPWSTLRGPLVFRAITYGSGRLFSPRISAGGIVSV